MNGEKIKNKKKGREEEKELEDSLKVVSEEWEKEEDDDEDEETEIETEFIPCCTEYIGEEDSYIEHECGGNCYCTLSEDEIFGKLKEELEDVERRERVKNEENEGENDAETENNIIHAEVVDDRDEEYYEDEGYDGRNYDEESCERGENIPHHGRVWSSSDDDETYDEDEILPGKEEAMRRLKKIAKLIDILEFVDSCLIVGERFVRDDSEAKEVIKEIRDKILSAETVLTDYLITGKMPKIQ